MLAAASSPQPGQVGPYRLIQRLGEGGMGVVHLGLDPQGRAVAVKVLRAHVAADPDARRRLEREVQTLQRVRHPHVAGVIDADVVGDLPYLVTRYVPGTTLDVHVNAHGPLARGHVARVGTVLADALRAIHALGIVHRDVKPANVMLLDGEPVLIDFGIAHVADEARITSTGLVMGTPGYLSPEIVGGQPVTAATDWWGWGATLAFAASGRSPFGTGPLEVVLDRVRRGDCDLTGVDEGLRPALAAALAVDPHRRPAPADLVRSLVTTSPVAVPAAVPAGVPVAVPASSVRTDELPSEPATVRGAPGMTEVVGTPATARYAPPVAPAPAVRATPSAGSPPASPPPGSLPPASPPPAPVPRPEAAPPREGAVAGQPGPDAARGVLFGVLVMLAAVAIVAPYGAFWWAVLLATVARVVDRSSSALLQRRNAYGRRGSDGVVTTLALPWRAVLAFGGTLLSMIIPLLVGVSTVFIAASVATGGDLQVVAPSSPGPLAAGMAALGLTAWWGPGGGSLRRGSRVTVRALTRVRRGRIAVWCAITLVVVSAVLTSSNGASPHWGPLEDSDLLQQLRGDGATAAATR